MNSVLIRSLLFAFTLILAGTTQAQNLVKQMDKKTKSELKEYIKDPSSYRKVVANHKDQLASYELQVTDLQESFYKAEYLKVLYYDSIIALNSILSEQSALINTNMLTGTTSGAGTDMYTNKGTEYRVQIGAYKYFDFAQLLKFNQPIGFDKTDDVIHYYLGSWSNADEAYEFTQAIRKLKVKDAFVSKYIDGTGVPYNHLDELGTALND